MVRSTCLIFLVACVVLASALPWPQNADSADSQGETEEKTVDGRHFHRYRPYQYHYNHYPAHYGSYYPGYNGGYYQNHNYYYSSNWGYNSNYGYLGWREGQKGATADGAAIPEGVPAEGVAPVAPSQPELASGDSIAFN